MHRVRRTRLLAASAAIVLAGSTACSSSPTTPAGSGSTGGAGVASTTGTVPVAPGTTRGTAAEVPDSIASTMVFGSGSECPNEPYCLPGLQSVYGLTWKEFVVTDSGGAKTIDALTSGSIQAGILFTTDPHVGPDGFVLLDDDQHLQPAENVTPILGEPIVAAYGPNVTKVIDKVSAKLTTTALTDLNKSVQIDGVSAANAATEFLRANNIAAGITEGTAPQAPGPTIVVGSANFSESTTLGELYAQALEGAGYPVERKFGIGNRATYFPMVQTGEIDLFLEYVGSLLGFLDEDADESADTAQAVTTLSEELDGSGLLVLQPAPAEDKNAVAVTSATASKYGLTKISDLARPAP